MTLFVRKGSIMLMTSSKQKKRILFKSNFLNLKHYVCQIFLPGFNSIKYRDRETAAILK